MKLRFRKNTLRLRVNRQEVELLACGAELSERVVFSGGATLDYILASSTDSNSSATFDGKVIRVTAPLIEWAKGGETGLYFEIEPGLKVAVERDLECVDGPPEEKDPYAFPRVSKAC